MSPHRPAMRRSRPASTSSSTTPTTTSGSIIGQNAAREVINQVNASIGERTLETVLTGLTDAGDGLVQAADGAEQLASGNAAANDGAQRLGRRRG